MYVESIGVSARAGRIKSLVMYEAAMGNLQSVNMEA